MIISVVVTTHNGMKFLRATIESVLAQTVEDWELVIVDDSSTDATSELAQCYVERDPRIRLVRVANRNAASSRNDGFAAISTAAEYVAFLDHDDIWEPDALETLLKPLQRDPRTIAAHGLARFIDAQGNPCRLGEAETWTRNRKAVEGERLIPCPPEMPTTFAVMVCGVCIFAPGQVLIRRSALEAVGPLDPDTAPADDYDLWLRLCVRGHMAYCDRVVLGYRRHENNVTLKVSLMRQKDQIVRRKVCAMPELTVEQRRVARAGWRLWYRHLAMLSYWEARKSLAKRQIVPMARHINEAVQMLMTANSNGR